MADRHAARGPGSTDVEWRRSHWDKLVHAFHADKVQDLTSEAECTHSALTMNLSQPIAVADLELSDLCRACLEIHAEELTKRIGERDRWGP